MCYCASDERCIVSASNCTKNLRPSASNDFWYIMGPKLRTFLSLFCQLHNDIFWHFFTGRSKLTAVPRPGRWIWGGGKDGRKNRRVRKNREGYENGNKGRKGEARLPCSNFKYSASMAIFGCYCQVIVSHCMPTTDTVNTSTHCQQSVL